MAAIKNSSQKNLAENQTVEFLQFAVWLGAPEKIRKPATQKKFGILFGIPERTLNRWKKDEQFQKAVKLTKRSWAAK